MFPISKDRSLNAFKAVRCLSGKDLFSRLGERIPSDRGSLVSRHPASRQDYAESVIMDGFNNLKETPDLSNVPPAVSDPEPPTVEE